MSENIDLQQAITDAYELSMRVWSCSLKNDWNTVDSLFQETGMKDFNKIHAKAFTRFLIQDNQNIDETYLLRKAALSNTVLWLEGVLARSKKIVNNNEYQNRGALIKKFQKAMSADEIVSKAENILKELCEVHTEISNDIHHNVGQTIKTP